MSFFITSLANTELNEDFTVSEYLRITFGKPTFIVNPAQWQTAGTTSTTYVTRLTKPGVVNPSPNEDPVVTDTTSPVITFSDGWTSGTTEILTGGLPTAIVQTIVVKPKPLSLRLTKCIRLTLILLILSIPLYGNR